MFSPPSCIEHKKKSIRVASGVKHDPSLHLKNQPKSLGLGDINRKVGMQHINEKDTSKKKDHYVNILRGHHNTSIKNATSDSEKSTDFNSEFMLNTRLIKSDYKPLLSRSNLNSVCENSRINQDAISKLSLRINDIKDNYKSIQTTKAQCSQKLSVSGLKTPNGILSKKTLGNVHGVPSLQK